MMMMMIIIIIIALFSSPFKLMATASESFIIVRFLAKNCF